MPQSRYRISSSFCNSFYDAYSSDTGSGYTGILNWGNNAQIKNLALAYRLLLKP